MLEGTKAELSVKIFGDDYDVLEKLAEQIKGILEKTPGAARSNSRPKDARRNCRSRPTATRSGATVSGGRSEQSVSAALAGQEVGTIVEGNRGTTSWCGCRKSCARTTSKSRSCRCASARPGLSRWANWSEFKTLKAVEPIQRDDGQRRAALMVNLERARRGRLRRAKPSGASRNRSSCRRATSIEFGGQFKNLQEARARLAVVVPSALALIFVLIFFAFGSLRQALLVYTGIPLAVTGGVFALWLRGMPFSITAAVGFIALERRGRAERPDDDQLLQPAARRRQIRPRRRASKAR